ncbi:MAG: hypothetical protein QF577_03205 [Phycisphaerae bacterium]|nr:hypothetical protein [Phycisphaerae bacterium]
MCLHKLLCLFVVVALLAWLAPQATAQDADADEAKAMLRQGIERFKAREYQSAKVMLLRSAESKALTGKDKAQLDSYLAKVDSAIKKQRAARQAYRDGEEALKANRLEEAQKHFRTAAASEYLDGATRKDAKAELTRVDAKIKAAGKARPKVAAKVQPKLQPKHKAPTKAPSDAEAANKGMAANLLAEGKRAMDNGQPDKAVEYLERALRMDPVLAGAENQLALARQLAASFVPAGDGILQRYTDRRSVAKGEAIMEFEKALKDSQELLASAESSAEFNAAASAAGAAGNVLESNKSLFDDAEYRARKVSVREQLKYVELRRDKWERQQAEKEREDLLKSKTDLFSQQKARKSRRISQLVSRAKALVSEYKYDQAVTVLNEVMVLDPKNRWAAEHKQLLVNFVFLQDEKGLVREFGHERTRSLLDLRRSEIPWHQELRYPRNWREITVARKPFDARAGGETELDREVRKKLDAEIPKLDFDEIELSDVVEFLREVSGANIYVKWKALAFESVEKSTTVNVHLRKVTLRKALQTILDDLSAGEAGAGLGYVISEGVITISTKSDLAKRAITRVYDIRDMIVRIPMFTGPRMELNPTGGADDEGGGEGGLFGDDSEEGTGVEVEQTRKELIEAIKGLIKETIDPVSWRDAGGEVGAIRELHGQLVVTQTAENHQALSELIGQLREARALQISIEARFITVSTGFLNRVGLDLDFYFNLGSRYRGPFSSPWAGGAPIAAIAGVDPLTGAPIVHYTPGVVAVAPPFTPGVPMTPVIGGNSTVGMAQSGRGWDPTTGAMRGLPPFTNAMATARGGDIGATVGQAALGIAGTFLDDIQVDFLLEATQAHESTRELNAPRITLFNGQRAYIIVSRNEAYVSGWESQIAEFAVSYTPEVSYVQSGAMLDVEATVSADRRYVTMTVRPQVTALIQMDLIATLGGVVELPIISIQDLQTTVSVPDGGTLLLGGQKISMELERELGVPLLSKVPVLRRLWTNTGRVRDEQTLLIMIRPKIIIQREEELKAFP